MFCCHCDKQAARLLGTRQITHRQIRRLSIHEPEYTLGRCSHCRADDNNPEDNASSAKDRGKNYTQIAQFNKIISSGMDPNFFLGER